MTDLKPNQTCAYPQITPGIARQMQMHVPVLAGREQPQTIAPAHAGMLGLGSTYPAGGGDMNGTAALIFLGHSGTGMGQLSMPRLRPMTAMRR